MDIDYVGLVCRGDKQINKIRKYLKTNNLKIISKIENSTVKKFK